MTGKMLNRLVILLLVAALAAVLISPVLAADTVSAPNNTDQAELTNLAVPQENIQGFDQDSHTAIP
jgi:opacity protein-like surface antigen